MLSPKGSPTERYHHALALAQQGRRAEALQILGALRLARPDTPEILFQIGRLEAAEGRAEAAEAALRRALALRPKEAAIWQALHGVLAGAARQELERAAGKARIVLGSEADLRPVYAALHKGQVDRAEAQALALVKGAPAAVWPALALGEARMARGAWGAALGPLDKAHERAPEMVRAQMALGETLERLDRFARAEPLLEAAMQAGQAPARLSLARLLRRTMRAEEAVVLLEGAPAAPALHEELALALADLGRGPEARAAVVRATPAGPARRALLRRVADALQGAGAIAEAEVTIEAALAADPGDPGLLTHRAQFRQSAGDLGGAETDLLAALAADPDAAEAYRAYMNGRKVAEGDPILTQLQARLARPGLPRDARRVMHFAAAKAAMDVRAPDAFSHLHTANRLTAEAFPYGFDADLEEARRLVADWDTLRDWTPEGPADPVLFVTGLPRSGTTLVETILSAHPLVVAGGEMPFLSRATAPALERLREGQGAASDFARAGVLYMRAARRRTGTQAGGTFTDKAISTFSRVGHVATALPGARIVILRRDPRDVGLSLYRNLFADGMHRQAYDLAAMGRYIRLHEALVAFWARALPDKVHVVDYEALTGDPAPQIRDLVAFCGLPWDDACLAPEKSDRRVETLSFAQVRAPIGRQAVAGWQRYEAELAPLIRALDETEVDLGV